MLRTQFRKPPQPAPLFDATEKTIIDDAKARCEVRRALLDRLAADVSVEQATFHGVLLPIEQNDDERWSSVNPGFYRKVAPSPGLRQAAAQAQKLEQSFDLECSMREDIFRLVDAVVAKGENLDPESQRLVEKTREEYIRDGVALPLGPARDRYKAIEERLSEIKTEYQRNIDESESGVWFTPLELAGLPEDVLEQLEKGTAGNTGKLRVTFKRTEYSPLMRFAPNPETRKRALIERENMCNENIPLFRETIDLRNEAALLLGYPNHAAKRLEVKMARTADTVMKFLDDLCSRTLQSVKKEVSELLATKKEESVTSDMPFDGNIYAWDLPFYSRIQKERKQDINQRQVTEIQVAEYFPLLPTISAMLRFFGHLFGLEFVEIKEDEDRQNVSPTGQASDVVWDESVILYAVWDDDSQGTDRGFVGYLYLDLYPRPGKYGHAFCATPRFGFQRPDGTRCYPATCLIANITKPTSSKPSLLKHGEVVTLLHELGHGMHDLVSRTTYSRFHGISVVRDFVEAPSQMLENWCWIPSCLRSFSSHYKTGEPIPEDMVKSLIAAERTNSAIDMMGQLDFALFDMTIHTQPVHEKTLDFSELFGALFRRFTAIKGVKALGISSIQSHAYASTRALFSGYDAGYYGYLWSKVYSTDMFHSAFQNDPMSKEAGRRYRRMVLEKGGAQDEMLTLEQFLGRKPSAEAFYRELGWTE